MTPTVFISSTIEDLRHIREAICETIEELGYNPIMSENGDVNYFSKLSADSACYQTLQNCQLMILVIGKRYGSMTPTSGGKSVTEHEYEICMKHKPRLITFVDKDVLSAKKYYDANKGTDLTFPGIENPVEIFSFFDRVSSAPLKNAIIPYSSTSEIRDKLKKQFAALFYDLLIDKDNPTQSSLNEIMVEVKTIRDALSREGRTPSMSFLATVRFLLDDRNKEFRQFFNATTDEPDRVIPLLANATTFEQLLSSLGVQNSITETGSSNDLPDGSHFKLSVSFAIRPFSDSCENGHYACDSLGHFVMNQSAFLFFKESFIALKRKIQQLEESNQMAMTTES